MELTLWFSKNAASELVQIRFQRAGKAPTISYRGKSLMYQHDAGLFQWTSAVKAFATLALRTKRWLLEKQSGETVALSGERGSAAAALDFAISKPTSWIVDVFGRESSGKAYARLLFKRENSEQKRAGPVRITFSNHLLEPHALKIYADGQEVNTVEEIQSLLDAIAGTPRNKKGDPQATKPTPVFKASWFKALLNRELAYALTETHLLDLMTIRTTCERVRREKPHAQKQINHIAASLEAMVAPEATRYSPKLSAAERDLFTSVACSPISVGALCIFHHLREKGYKNLTINASYPSSSSILESGDIAQVDAAVLTWGAGIKLLQTPLGRRFAPVMLLPRSAFGFILAPGYDSPKQVQRVLLGADPEGYPVELLRRLTEMARVSSNVTAVNANASEIMSHLGETGEGAIIGSPLSALIAKKHDAAVMWDRDDALRFGESILFVRKDLPAQHLVKTIQRSWFSLLEDERLLEETAEKIFSEVTFINYLHRQASLYKGEVAQESDVIPAYREDCGRQIREGIHA